MMIVMKPSMSCLTFAMAAVISVLQPRVSFAQIGYNAKSIEWRVARSDVVVRASISKVVRERPHGQFVYIAVTLEVHETLKGKQTRSVTYLVETIRGFKRYEGWRDAKREFLGFLVRNQDYRGKDQGPGTPIPARYPLKGSLLRLGPPVPAEKGIRSFPPSVFDMKLNVFEKPKDILEAAKRAAAFKPGSGKLRYHDINLPRAVMQWSGVSGDANRLLVPVDSRLELLARELIRSPRDILSKRGRSSFKRKQEQENKGYLAKKRAKAKNEEERGKIKEAWAAFREREKNSLRREGVKALRYFKSKKNIALLKPLLKDGAWYVQHIRDDRKDAKRVYYIRKAAYETLREWGVRVEKPVLEERMPR